jgi:hypothetical protein
LSPRTPAGFSLIPAGRDGCYPAKVLVVAVLLAVGLASVGLLAVLLIALIRHMKLLAASLRRFQDEVQPILEEIQAESVSAQDKMQRMQERRER